jgi:hypothetical protein
MRLWIIQVKREFLAWVLQCMTGISFDIIVGGTILEGYFDLLLGKLHEIPLNNAQESSSYLIGTVDE